MRVYLAGPMTGHSDFNQPNFLRAAGVLRDWGYDVFVPHEADIADGFNWTGMAGTVAELEAVGFDIRKAVARNVDQILERTDLIVLMPGWERSKGTAVELTLAIQLDLPIYEYVDGDTDDVVIAPIDPSPNWNVQIGLLV